MSDILRAFQYGEKPVRVVLHGEEPWWVAADVCAVLGIKNAPDALKRLDADERTLVSTDGASNGLPVNAVNEAGLYTLILSSRKAEARDFKRWITHEIMPAIRRTGGYSIEPSPTADLSSIVLSVQEAVNAMSTAVLASVGALEKRVAALESSRLVEPASPQIGLREACGVLVKRLAERRGTLRAVVWGKAYQEFDIVAHCKSKTQAKKEGMAVLSWIDHTGQLGTLLSVLRAMEGRTPEVAALPAPSRVEVLSRGPGLVRFRRVRASSEVSPELAAQINGLQRGAQASGSKMFWPRMFLEECCVAAGGAVVEGETLYRAYAAEAGERPHLGRTAFVKEMEARLGFKSFETGGARYWDGLGFSSAYWRYGQ